MNGGVAWQDYLFPVWSAGTAVWPTVPCATVVLIHSGTTLDTVVKSVYPPAPAAHDPFAAVAIDGSREVAGVYRC